MRVMEVAFYESDQTGIDFIIEPDWTLWVTDFFIEGGLDIPPEINMTKPLKDLTEKDYKLFFEELINNFLNSLIKILLLARFCGKYIFLDNALFSSKR